MDPVGSLKKSFSSAVNEALSEMGFEPMFEPFHVGRVPKTTDMMGIPVGFKLAKLMRVRPDEASKRVASALDVNKIRYAKELVPSGGYLNLRVDESLFRDIIEYASLEELGKGAKPDSMEFNFLMVEHTSVNPVHPLHVGGGRNAVIGDSYSRILRFAGYKVTVHYLVNDCNLQVALAAAGRAKARNLIPKGKPDHWFGLIYALANASIELKELEGKEDPESKSEYLDWIEAVKRIREKEPEMVSLILGKVTMEETMELLRKYQRGDEEAKEIFREVANSVMKGFLQTLGRMGIVYDSLDWESELIWGGWVDRALKKLEESGYLGREGNAVYVDLKSAILEKEDVRKIFGLTEEEVRRLVEKGELDQVVPPKFYLTRSDGTWLYTGTDVAYSLFKIEGVGVDRCYNVIATEQTLEQKQVRASVALMGYDPDRIIHLAYEMVNLVGARMSGRKARYVTLDELLDEAKSKVKEILRGRGDFTEEEVDEISEKVAVGAVRYALINVSPIKVIQFSWDRVLDFESNSGPFIQYSYTRALGILRKAPNNDGDYDVSLLSSELERELIFKMGEFPEVIRDSIKFMRPDLISQYANDLSITFNKFYEKYKVIGSGKYEQPRLALVRAFKGVLGTSMDLLGIPRIERM